jgi:hypothetical protein
MYYKGASMRIISVRLDPKADEQLRSICKRTGMSQTDAVKAGIAALADRPRVDPHALAVQLGLIGCVEGEVDDLGVNHSRYVKEKLARRRG